MKIPHVNSIVDRDFRNTVNLVIDKVNNTTSEEMEEIPDLGYLENNRGAIYPLMNIMRDGAMHPVQEMVKDVVLSARVYGASPDKFYCLEWIGNGFVSSGKALWGVGISEFKREGNSFNTETRREIVKYNNDIIPEQTEDIISRTIEIKSEGLVFEITYDRSKILGSAINIARTEGRAYGCVIHQDNYVYRTDSLKDLTSENLRINKTANEFTVYQEQPSGKHLGYTMRYSDRPYVEGVKTSNVKLWSFKDASEYSQDGSKLRTFYQNATQDLMIRESKVTDYMGGDAHGDEILQSVELFVDGKEIGIDESHIINCKEVKLVQTTHLYRDTIYTNGELEHVATARKLHIFNKDGYMLDVTLKFHESVTLRECQIGAVSMNRKDEENNNLVEKAIFSNSLAEVDLQEVTSDYVYVDNAEKVYITGNNAGINWKTNRLSNEQNNRTWVNTSNANMVKLYSSYCSNGYTTEIDEVFSQQTLYEYIIS